MTIQNPQLTRLSAVDIILGDGTQTPNATIDDGLLITTDSGVTLDQLELNSQDDVVSPSKGKRKTIIGSKGGTATISGNLTSFGTKVSKQPAIHNMLLLSGMQSATVDTITFTATPTNIVVGTVIEDVGQTKQGTVKAIDDLVVHITPDTGTFAAADVIQTVTGASAVGTVDSIAEDSGMVYRPDSDSNQVGSIHYYMDGQRKAISDCASNFEVSAEASQFGKFTCTAMGKYDADKWAPAALPAVTYADAIDPAIFMDSGMLLTFDGVGYTPVNTTVNFNFGATPNLRRNSVDSTGLVGGFVSSRADASGSVTIENETQTDFDYINTMLDSELGTLSWRLGDGTDGETIYFHQNVNITGSSVADENGLSTVTFELNVIDVELDDNDSFIMFV